MNEPFISIIIVSWNAIHHLKRFLPSVVATEYRRFEIILADNASTDESAEWVKTNFPTVLVHTLDKNYGYCGGNNKAADVANGDILLFLNNDVEVDENWLNALSSIFSDETVGAAQPKLRAYLQKEKFEYAGAAGGYIDYLGYPFCKGRVFDTLETDYGQYDTPDEIIWASGAALAIRKDVFLELGGFDESFEFHMEEIDLCWRLLRTGKRIVYVPDSVVYHLGGGSLNALSPRKTYYNFRNNWWMLMKNIQPNRFYTILWRRLLLDVIAAAYELFKLRFTHANAILQGLYDAFTKPKSYLELNNDVSDKIYPYSIVKKYFIENKKTFDEL
ncbi:glycosyltransferase family 2 protein [bacterium]|nr:MAG: glycosyltransferase family 2 protein [bacterium]